MKIDKIRKNFRSLEETRLRIELVLRLILENSSPVSIILFGSAARNELTSSSDIDVVVIVYSMPCKNLLRSVPSLTKLGPQKDLRIHYQKLLGQP